jgi:hypothetical protein
LRCPPPHSHISWRNLFETISSSREWREPRIHPHASPSRKVIMNGTFGAAEKAGHCEGSKLDCSDRPVSTKLTRCCTLLCRDLPSIVTRQHLQRWHISLQLNSARQERLANLGWRNARNRRSSEISPQIADRRYDPIPSVRSDLDRTRGEC